MSTFKRGISRCSLPLFASQYSGRKPGMRCMPEVFASMLGVIPVGAVDACANGLDAGRQKISAIATIGSSHFSREINLSIVKASARRKKPSKVHRHQPPNNFGAAYFRRFY